MGLIKRLYTYQLERFPLIILAFTTLAVILSSTAVALGPNAASLGIKSLVGVYISSLLFMFTIRVFDDNKDHEFDTKYHKDRPIQRGVVSIPELNKINTIGLIVQVTISLLISLTAFLYWVIAFLYSFVASKNFFSKKIHNKFILYNIANLLQLFFLQLYIYSIVNPAFNLKDPMLSIHFVFVIINAGILEVARKMKGHEEEGKGKDTYSSRYGTIASSAIYSSLCIFSFAMFSRMAISLSGSLNAGIAFLAVTLIATLMYSLKSTRVSSLVLQASAIIFYMSMHILLMVIAF